jgi:23S rRNA pseudouridine1911/1915/1917 synthase
MKEIIIKDRQVGKRIDKFLASAFAKAPADKQEFFSYSRGEIIRNIKAGNILVNGKKVKPSYKLHQDSIISCKLPTTNHELIPNPSLKIKIIYQNENLIIIDKPAGLQVHPDKYETKNTLVNWLVYKFPKIKSVHDNSPDAWLRPGIVHRLDKDTSGVMAIAKNIKAFLELKNLFKSHEIEKKYFALVYGKLKNKSGVISKLIARSSTYRKQVIAGRKTKTKIRSAITEYKVLKEFNNYTLLEVTPKTGRMHQIRVHLFSIGHPIVGDKLYKFKNIKRVNAPRQMLHAEIINFKIFGESYAFNADPPRDMMDFIGNID